MSEFKFSCPKCGQHLIGDKSWAGQRIQCPGCQSDFVVPTGSSASAPRSAPSLSRQRQEPALPRSASPTGFHKPSGQTVCGLAVASLVLTLLTLPFNLGTVLARFPTGLLACVPGLIIGHIALVKIRRSDGLAGREFALAGVVGGYVFSLLLLLGGWAIIRAPRIDDAVMARLSLPPVEQSNPSISMPPAPRFPPPASAPPRISPRPNGPMPPLAPRPPIYQPPVLQPAPRPSFLPPPTSPAQPARRDPKLTTNPQTVAIPSTAVSGRLGGQNFSVTRATLQGDVLTLAQGADMVPEFQVMLFLFGQAASGKTLLVPNPNPNAIGSTPHVHLRWKDAGGRPQMTSLAADYVMRLEIAPTSGNTITGRIYLEFPQSYQTRFAGTFQAQRL